MKLTWLFVVLVELFKDGQGGFGGAFRSQGAEAGFGIEFGDADGSEFLDQFVDADLTEFCKLAEAGVFVVGDADGEGFHRIRQGSLHGKRRDFRFDVGTGFGAGFAEVVFVLEADPELGTGAEVAAEAQGSVRGDSPAAVDDGCYAAVGDMKINGEAVLGDAQWLQELGADDLAGVREF